MTISRFLSLSVRNIRCFGIAIIYVLLALLGILGIILFQVRTGVGMAETFRIGALWETIIWGVGCATCVIILSLIGSKALGFMESLENEFRVILGDLKPYEILVIALASGIAEEIFFRGAFQPLLGLVATSLIFGLAHFPVNKRLIPWTIFAIGMGFLLGALYIKTGNVVTPIITHVLINLINLFRISRK